MAHLRFVEIHSSYQEIMSKLEQSTPEDPVPEAPPMNELFQNWMADHLDQHVDAAEQAYEQAQAACLGLLIGLL